MVIRPWQNLPTNDHGHVICMGNLEVVFSQENTPEGRKETHKSSFFPYKQVSGRNSDHEWLRMTNAFILCDLVWKVKKIKSHAANREGSFNKLQNKKCNILNDDNQLSAFGNTSWMFYISSTCLLLQFAVVITTGKVRMLANVTDIVLLGKVESLGFCGWRQVMGVTCKHVCLKHMQLHAMFVVKGHFLRHVDK